MQWKEENWSISFENHKRTDIRIIRVLDIKVIKSGNENPSLKEILIINIKLEIKLRRKKRTELSSVGLKTNV